MKLIINGVERADLDYIQIKDANGNGANYFKIRDLAAAIGFDIDNRGRTVIINTGAIPVNPQAIVTEHPTSPSDEKPKNGEIRDGYVYNEAFGWVKYVTDTGPRHTDEEQTVRTKTEEELLATQDPDIY